MNEQSWIAVKKQILIKHDGLIKNRGKAYCPHCYQDIHGIGKILICPKCKGLIRWE